MGTVLNAAIKILSQAGEPLHYREITRRVLNAGLWRTSGKTPWATLGAQITTEIKRRQSESRFVRVARGTFALRGSVAHPVSGPGAPTPAATAKAKTVSFTDAAEMVLTRFGKRRPMHYREITRKAIELGLISTGGRTPEATMYAQLFQENRRRTRRGERTRFERYGKGMVGLSKWHGEGPAYQIDRHNREVRKKLHERVRDMEPDDFEGLVGRMLAEIGFADVAVTGRSGDGGIDVRGTLVVGEVIRTRMAVQVKRWKQNVQAPVVQQVRGSLGAHEQGLIITTSDFSKGARQEAERADAVPVALMNGQQLVSLLTEHSIGIRRTAHELIELGEKDVDDE